MYIYLGRNQITQMYSFHTGVSMILCCYTLILDSWISSLKKRLYICIFTSWIIYWYEMVVNKSQRHCSVALYKCHLKFVQNLINDLVSTVRMYATNEVLYLLSSIMYTSTSTYSANGRSITPND